MQTWIEHLRHLTPPNGVMHVGAGSESATRQYADWAVPAVLLVEADERLHEKLESAVKGRAGWSTHCALLSERAEEAVFHVASNPNESGLLAPERLSALWRNIKTAEHRSAPAKTLHGLLSESTCATGDINWLTVDCLPALPILRGTGDRLDSIDVIRARVLFDAQTVSDLGASKDELDRFLAALGFLCVATEEERHPAIGTALYVRQWKDRFRTEHDELLKAKEAQTKHAVEWQRQLEQLTKARDEQKALVGDREAQIARLTQANEELAALASDRQTELERVTQAIAEQSKLALKHQGELEQTARALAEQSKLALEHQGQIEQLKKARDEQAALAAERQKQVAQLTEAHTALAASAAERQAELEQSANALAEQSKVALEHQGKIEQLTKARDDQAYWNQENSKWAKSLKSKNEQLEGQLEKLRSELEEYKQRAKELDVANRRLVEEGQDRDARQRLLDTQILQAEAQLELIKDVLLREKNF